ncbi:extracellular solute-binding protein [Microbacterium sp. 18062]|uniref:extracellular solute-binding protein n=1 Tax=Microbacterium sp. 18062 TaxID=2681410 RepID=UPI0013580A10|nr:extracellular solute-binding protein [Microbacterium sp. 18062]
MLSHRTRRGSIIGAVLVAGVAVTGCAATTPAADSSDEALSGQIVWADWGGSTNEAFEDIFFAPFTEETGVEVVPTIMSASVQYEMLEGGEGDYDTMMTGMSEVVLYSENLVPLPEGIPRSDQLDAAAAEFTIATPIIGYAQGYLADAFPGGGPETWADFWDTETFPGKRAVPGEYSDFMFEAALLADGVAPEDLYPLDLDRAVAKLDELKPDMVFYTEYPQVQQLLTSEGASIAFAPNGQYAALKNAGVEVTVSWYQALVEANPFVVPTGASNQAATFALAELLADPELQADFSRRTDYGPSNSAAFDFLTDDEIAALPNAPEHTDIIWSDAENRAELYQEMTDRYTEWLTS